MRIRQAPLVALCIVLLLAAVGFCILWRQARADGVMARGSGAVAEAARVSAESALSAAETAGSEAEARAAALEAALAEAEAETRRLETALAEAEALSYPERLRASVAENHAITVHAAEAESGGLPYLLYEPRGLDADEPHPLLVFLHGSGECGSDPALIYEGGSLPVMLRDGLLTPNALVLMPQCPLAQNWSTQCEPLKALIDGIVETYNVDRARISITGFSLGGIGVFVQLTHYPDFYSAAVPVSSTYSPAACAVITSTPVRILHGSMDTGMGFDVMQINSVINNAGGRCELLLYYGEGHFIQEHYLDDEGAIVNWLIAQRRTD